MTTDANEVGRLPTAPTARPSPPYNLVSIGAPFLGVLGVWLFLGIVGTGGHWYWTWRGPAAMAILVGSCVVGDILAFIAWFRSERLWGLTALGFLLSAPLPAVLAWAGVWQLISWLRYG